MVTAVFFSQTRMLASVGDPDGTRTITSIVALLIALGLALAMIAVWVFRSTRPDPEVLAPLEVMGDRRWRRSDPVAQRRRLDEFRPTGAKPLTPSAAPPNLDEAYDAGPTAPGFDDLAGEPAGAADSTDATGRPVTGGSPLPPPREEYTPQQIDRPDGFDHEIDPALLAAAAAELDAEMHRKPDAD